MFFCEKCSYLFNVTKDVKSKQIGGKINDALTGLFNKYGNGEKIVEKDLGNIKGKYLVNDERFENMSKKDQRSMMSVIKAVDKNFFVEDKNSKNSKGGDAEVKVGSNVAFFICKYCKNSKPIKPQTIIYTKNYGGVNSIEPEDYSYAIYDYTLPRTRNYICKNKNCETHNNNANKEAIITKNALGQVIYICGTCTTNWISMA